MANLQTLLLLLLWICLAPWTTSTSSSNGSEAQSTEEFIRVVIGFNTSEQQEEYMTETMANDDVVARSSLSTPFKRRAYKYRRSNAMAMNIHPSQWDELANDPRISYIHRDSRFQLYQRNEEIIPYGIEMVQGTSTTIPLPAYASGDCEDPNSFKVCVVDSGLLVGHTDIPFNLTANNIVGEEFGIDSPWYRPSAASSHGTHVTGTILARGNNGVGVVGVVPNPQGICLLIARSFDERNDQDASLITQAVEWCAEKGARIINLSLGTEDPLSFSDIQVYEQLFYSENVLVVAAAGNKGDNTFSYPASLGGVMSVAATNENFTRASFSQFNEQVDIAAPGVLTLSTTSSNGALLTTPNIFIDSSLMLFSIDTPEILLDVPLEMVDCRMGFEPCTGATSKACIMQRGINPFWEKAWNCQKGGGLVAFVYNNVDGGYGGNLLRNDTGVIIPVFSISRADGMVMLENLNTTKVSLQVAAPSYGYLDGTSMAAPHVTGVATKIWAARPNCTNLQIREALENSAMDLGPNGWDQSFGIGLVQADAAYQYILTNFDAPCGNRDPSTANVSCLSTYATCTSDEACCTGRCAPLSVNGPTMCRTATQATKTKLSPPRGGSAAGALRNFDGRRLPANNKRPRVRGGSSQ